MLSLLSFFPPPGPFSLNMLIYLHISLIFNIKKRPSAQHNKFSTKDFKSQAPVVGRYCQIVAYFIITYSASMCQDGSSLDIEVSLPDRLGEVNVWSVP